MVAVGIPQTQFCGWRARALLTLAADGLFLTRPACTVQDPIANWDAAAQLIAGIGNNSYAAAMTDDQKTAWADYSKTAASDWNRLKRRYVDRITAWRGKYLQKIPSHRCGFLSL